jgi:hypothetical protein
MGWEEDAHAASLVEPDEEDQQCERQDESSVRRRAGDVVKLSGTICNLKVTRSSASFVLTSSDQTKFGIIAIAAALAGMDGQAAAASHYASDMDEVADYVEFDLNEHSVKGWVWRNPFHEGDVVNVAAEQVNGHWEAYGIVRPSDRTVALYPHCSRGSATHYKNAFFWWVAGTFGALVFCGGAMLMMFSVLDYFPEGIAVLPAMFLTFSHFLLLFASFLRYGAKGVYVYGLFWLLIEANQLNQLSDSNIMLSMGLVMVGCVYAFSALMTFSLSRKWLPIVRVAEKVFRALELPNPSNIDLVKSSKAQRTAQDPGEFGTFYFRY